jgi:hypothetical protein
MKIASSSGGDAPSAEIFATTIAAEFAAGGPVAEYEDIEASISSSSDSQSVVVERVDRGFLTSGMVGSKNGSIAVT